MADSAIENLRAHVSSDDSDEMSRGQRVEALLQALEQHDQDAGFLKDQAAKLGLDAKTLKQLRAVRKTYNELMGFDADTAARVKP